MDGHGLYEDTHWTQQSHAPPSPVTFFPGPTVPHPELWGYWVPPTKHRAVSSTCLGPEAEASRRWTLSISLPLGNPQETPAALLPLVPAEKSSNRADSQPTGDLPPIPPHSLRLICGHVCVRAQLCLTLCHPTDYSPSGSSVHGIFQARILEWVAVSSRGSSWPRDQNRVSWIGRWLLYHWATWEAWRPRVQIFVWDHWNVKVQQSINFFCTF